MVELVFIATTVVMTMMLECVAMVGVLLVKHPQSLTHLVWPHLLHIALGTECSDGSIRLIGSTVARQGRVEICLEGRWGTVCDTSWDSRDAAVVCRQLGHSSLGECITGLLVTKTLEICLTFLLPFSSRCNLIYQCTIWLWEWSNLARFTPLYWTWK